METLSRRFKFYIIIFLPFLFVFLLVMQSCNMDDLATQPKGDYIDGFALFIDTNYVTSGGNYGIALYNNNPSPFIYEPVYVDTINLAGIVSGHSYSYRMHWGGKGNYFAAVVWMRNSGGTPIVLGTYGCDTCHTCTSHEVIAFPNFTGSNYNIRCWNDTSQALH